MRAEFVRSKKINVRRFLLPALSLEGVRVEPAVNYSPTYRECVGTHEGCRGDGRVCTKNRQVGYASSVTVTWIPAVSHVTYRQVPTDLCQDVIATS